MSVSVVIMTHNRADTLARAIVSAACQNPVEVLVIDDASTDDTPGLVEQLATVYPCVRLHRHKSKAADWQEAAAALYPSLLGTHAICMGADDKLELGVVASVDKHPDAAVVFHDYWLADTAGNNTGAVTMGFEEPARLSPRQMRDRVRERPWASETGIGSGIRKDQLLWLNSLGWWRMGPWSDAVGYAAVAVNHGAAYEPGAGATFTVDDAGYGQTHRTGPDAEKYHDGVRQFLRDAGVPFSVAAAICVKRGVPYG